MIFREIKLHSIVVLTGLLFYSAALFAIEPQSFINKSAALQVSETASVRAQLRPKTHTVLAARMNGLLKSFAVRPGDLLMSGSPIAQFDCQEQQAEQAVIKARLSAASSKHKINLELAKMDNLSQLDLSLSTAELAIARAETQRIQAVLRKCSVLAPFNGMVMEKFIQPFQYVAEGEPLLRLVDTENLEVEMVVPSSWLKHMQVGVEFQLDLDDFNQQVEARVNRIIGEIDPVSQTVHIVGSIIKSSAGLLPGMSGQIQLPTGPKH
jgi:RND family efflux transporter MFP subunit